MVAEMVEQGRQLLLEQRQPMLHARQPPPVADRLVERIAGGVGAELLAIAGAEALDRLLVEQGLAGRHQGEGLGLAGRALVGGVEPAHRLDLVAEEVEPERRLLARREQVDDRAAHRIFAGVVRRRRCADSRWRSAARPASRGRSARPRRGAGSAGGYGTASARAGWRRWRWRPAAAGLFACACRASRSPAARPSPAAPARRGRRAGSPRPGKSAPPPRARTPAPCPASARIAASSAAMTTARPPLPVPCAARARSAASHGRKPAGTPARVSGRVAR